MRRALIGFALLSLLPACKSSRQAERQAAKERFLTGSVLAPTERGVEIDVAKAARDPQEMEKAHLLGASAVSARLKSFRFRGRTEYRASRGRRTVKLAEQLEWHQAGKGSFYTKVENQRGHGVEGWWTPPKFFLRRRYGKLRERPVEGHEYLKFREDTWGAWPAVYRLFKGMLRFREMEPVQVGGRRAARFEVSLADAPQTRIADTLQPQPEKLDLGDIKVSTAARRQWRRLAKPVAAQGTVDLDAETGVPLAVDLRGRLVLSDPEENADLTVVVRHALRDVGRDVEIQVPEGAVLEPTMRKVESRRFELIDMVRIEDFLIDRWEFPNEKGAAPKMGVGWRAARDACRAVGKRLCTSKEWQKACNSDRRRNRYPYGRIYKPERCHTEGTEPKPVGERRDCRGEFEVYDLTGNVAEWVETKGKDDRREWCVAGGAFDDKEKARCNRCIPRAEVEDPDSRIGFRCCR